MKQYQFKTISNLPNQHQTQRQQPYTNVIFYSRVENKEGKNLSHPSATPSPNIEQMKNKLSELLRQTDMLSEGKYFTSPKNQKNVTMGTSRGHANSSISSDGRGYTEQYRFGTKLNTSHREGWGSEYKKQEPRDVVKTQRNQSGSGYVNRRQEQTIRESPVKLVSFNQQRNGINNFNNNNSSRLATNGHVHKFIYENNVQSQITNNNSESRKIEIFRQAENNNKLLEEILPISQPSQPAKPNFTEQSSYQSNIQFSPNQLKQKPHTNYNSIQSPTKSVELQTPRNPSTSLYQPNNIGSLSTSLSMGSDYTFGTSASISEKKQQRKPIQIPNNLSDCQYRLKVLDQQCIKLKQQAADLADGKEYYRKQLSQQWRNNKKLKQQHELNIVAIKKQHREEIQKYIEKNQKTIQEYEQKIKVIKNQHRKELQKVEDIVCTKQKNISQLINQLAEAKVKPVYQSYELKATKILSENKQLINTLIQKQSQLSSLKTELIQKSSKIEQLSERVLVLEKQVAEFGSLNEYKQFSSLGQNFDSILMLQLKSISEFKDVIERLNEKNGELNQKLFESNRKIQLYQNEHRISELKTKSVINNLTVQSSIIESNKENIISSLNKKLQTLEQKYKAALNQIKRKDEFLKQHLVGRTDMIDVQEYIENLLKKYQQYFGESREAELQEELQKVMKKIQLYEKYK